MIWPENGPLVKSNGLLMQSWCLKQQNFTQLFCHFWAQSIWLVAKEQQYFKDNRNGSIVYYRWRRPHFFLLWLLISLSNLKILICSRSSPRRLPVGAAVKGPSPCFSLALGHLFCQLWCLFSCMAKYIKKLIWVKGNCNKQEKTGYQSSRTLLWLAHYHQFSALMWFRCYAVLSPHRLLSFKQCTAIR